MPLADGLNEDWKKGYDKGLKDVETMDAYIVTAIVYAEDEEELLRLFSENNVDARGVSRDYIDGWIEGIKEGYKHAKS